MPAAQPSFKCISAKALKILELYYDLRSSETGAGVYLGLSPGVYSS